MSLISILSIFLIGAGAGAEGRDGKVRQPEGAFLVQKGSVDLKELKKMREELRCEALKESLKERGYKNVEVELEMLADIDDPSVLQKQIKSKFQLSQTDESSLEKCSRISYFEKRSPPTGVNLNKANLAPPWPEPKPAAVTGK